VLVRSGLSPRFGREPLRHRRVGLQIRTYRTDASAGPGARSATRSRVRIQVGSPAAPWTNMLAVDAQDFTVRLPIVEEAKTGTAGAAATAGRAG
jgi:hypothetical protein